MINPMITAIAGWSPAVELRAQRLLDYVIGAERNGMPVTIATMFARSHYDPVASARFLMHIPPINAVHELAQTLSRFRIDGEVCPTPESLARAALIHAGRAVSPEVGHPETGLAHLMGWVSRSLERRRQRRHCVR